MHRIVSEPRSESPRESTLSLQVWVYEPVALVDIKRYSIDLLHAYSLLFSVYYILKYYIWGTNSLPKSGRQ